jgi:hypothetical protein
MFQTYLELPIGKTDLLTIFRSKTPLFGEVNIRLKGYGVVKNIGWCVRL